MPPGHHLARSLWPPIRPKDPSVWYTRRLAWLATTPCIIFVLWTVSGATADYAMLAIGSDMLMHVCFLIATLVDGTEASKWIFWLFGCHPLPPSSRPIAMH